MAEVKMKDIAAAVGVSVVTVSNALSGRKGVSEDVRQLVEKTARDMGYNQKKTGKALPERGDWRHCLRKIYYRRKFFLLGYVPACGL